METIFARQTIDLLFFFFFFFFLWPNREGCEEGRKVGGKWSFKKIYQCTNASEIWALIGSEGKYETAILLHLSLFKGED